MEVDDIFKKFTEFAELQDYCSKQHVLIETLQTENKKLTEEIKHLKSLLDSSVPNLQLNSSKKLDTPANEELICQMELEKLKLVSIDRALTLEEAKKVDIYTKLLLNIQTKKQNKDDSPTSQMNDAELLSLLDDDTKAK